MPILLGCIADDFTGATDLANTLVKNGMTAVQVIGVPDPKFGEEVLACVKLREGAMVDSAAIVAFCRGQIAHYKVPRYIRFVDSFPMTASGKVQKYLLREAMLELLSSA